MTRDDLIIAAPWIAFVAGLSVIGFRLRARGAAGPGPGRRWPGPRRSGASGPAEPSTGQETTTTTKTREGQCPEKKPEARSR